jgi:thiol:disulfide interchange protein DsbD
LLAGGEPLLVLGGFFVAGLLLAFTACLYPMVPILSGLIAGDRHRGSSLRSFLLSLVYVEATAVTYALAGIAAGFSGIAIQANLQSPWVLGTFAGLFVLLSLSMFGVFSLQLPAGLQTRLTELSGTQKGGTFIGAAIMGVLSALIVGACSGPALIAALAFISSTGDYVLGGLALFILANGMGLPLLLIGTAAGRWLPRSGPWMERIRQLFGIGFLVVALWLVERLLPGHLALALWGALLLGVAVYLGAFDQITHNAGGIIRLRKFGGVLLLIWSSLLLLGAAGGSTDFWRPLAGFTARTDSVGEQLASRRIYTVDELDSALAQARAAGQPVMLDVRADWCVYCIQLERSTFPAPQVQQALRGALLLTVDVTAMNSDDKTLLNRLDVFLPPAVIFYDAQGIERSEQRVVGFLEPAAFAARARQALSTSAQPL